MDQINSLLFFPILIRFLECILVDIHTKNQRKNVRERKDTSYFFFKVTPKVGNIQIGTTIVCIHTT